MPGHSEKRYTERPTLPGTVECRRVPHYPTSRGDPCLVRQSRAPCTRPNVFRATAVVHGAPHTFVVKVIPRAEAAELDILLRLRHRNVVSVVAYSRSLSAEVLLMMPAAPYTLSEVLESEQRARELTWNHRVAIANGIGDGPPCCCGPLPSHRR